MSNTFASLIFSVSLVFGPAVTFDVMPAVRSDKHQQTRERVRFYPPNMIFGLAWAYLYSAMTALFYYLFKELILVNNNAAIMIVLLWMSQAAWLYFFIRTYAPRDNEEVGKAKENAFLAALAVVCTFAFAIAGAVLAMQTTNHAVIHAFFWPYIAWTGIASYLSIAVYREE